VPDPLTSGSSVELLEDNGDTAWYGDTLTSKTGLSAALQKDLGQVFTYQAGSTLATTTAVTSSPASTAVTGQQVTYTATVTGPSGAFGAPTGTIAFQDSATGTAIPGCTAQPLTDAAVASGQSEDTSGAAASTATCTVSYPAIGNETVTASYAGDSSFEGSSAVAEAIGVNRDTTVTTVTSSENPAAYGGNVTLEAHVAAASPGSGTPTGTVTFSVSASGSGSGSGSSGSSGNGGGKANQPQPLHCSGASAPAVGLTAGVAQCVVNTKDLGAPGSTVTITASYSGDASYLAGSGTLQQQVARIPTTTKLSVTPSSVIQGEGALISVSLSASPVSLLPPMSGAVTVTVTTASGARVSTLCLLLPGLGGICVIPAGELTAAQGPYTISATYAGDAAYAPSTATAPITVTEPRRP
jgi:hypothetical protein